MADTQKFDFAMTNKELAELSVAIAGLNTALSAKKNELMGKGKTEELNNKEQRAKIELLQESSQNVVNNIDSVINKLNTILENNGTSNNNN